MGPSVVMDEDVLPFYFIAHWVLVTLLRWRAYWRRLDSIGQPFSWTQESFSFRNSLTFQRLGSDVGLCIFKAGQFKHGQTHNTKHRREVLHLWIPFTLPRVV